jgi:hypothetical protein
MLRPSVCAAFAGIVLSFAGLSRATIVNFDINGQQPGDAAPPTFSGIGAAGGGTTFNTIGADSTSGNNAQTFSSSTTGLVDSNGNALADGSFGFTAGLAGGDNNAASSDPTAASALTQDYLFISGNGTGNATFTITVPASTTSAQIHFYSQNNGANTAPASARFPNIVVNGGTLTANPTGTGTLIPTANIISFDVPSITGGTITGTFTATPNGETISGLTVNTPEPTTAGVLAGLAGLALRRRSRRHSLHN